MMAAATHVETFALAPELALEHLVPSLTERRPRIMQLIIEDPGVRRSFEIRAGPGNPNKTISGISA
jgi:hypothetical protein